MIESADRLADVPLTRLLPGLGERSRAQLCRKADRLDLARPRGDVLADRWLWNPDSAEVSEHGNKLEILVFGTSVTVMLAVTGVDWLELSLDVCRTAEPPVAVVSAAVEVACFCPVNHNVHPVRERRWLFGAAEALFPAFDTAVDAVIEWLDGPREPPAWRAAAGLPNDER